MLAVSDHKYRFTYLDVGAFRCEGDKHILSANFGKKLLNEELSFPAPDSVNNEIIPYYFIGDSAFPLGKRIMKPYSCKQTLTEEETIFNYRLSRARCCVENALGILCTKWGCLKSTIFYNPMRAQKLINACSLLHNYLINTNNSLYCPANYTDRQNENGEILAGEWRNRIPADSLWHNKPSPASGQCSESGKKIREHLTKYFSTIGGVPWQKKFAGLE